jgi:Spy/CpxP family protein refolding chaperone
MKRLMMLLAAALLAAAPAMAQPAQRPGGHGRMGGPMMGPGGPMAILRGLNLTDDQRQQIKAILDENRPSEPPQTMQLERKLHAAVINGDAGAIEALKTQLLQAHEQELDRQIAVLQKIVPILTPDQKQQLLNRD